MAKSKTATPRSRTTRQSKRLNPEAVEEEENATPEDQAKDEQEEDQKVVEDKPEIEVAEAKGESDSTDSKLEPGNVQEDQAECSPANVDTEDQPKDDTKDDRMAVEDKPETKDEQIEVTSTDVQAHPELPLKEEEEEDGGEEQIEVTSADVQAHPELPLKEEEEEDGGGEKAETTTAEVSEKDIKYGEDAEVEAVIKVNGNAPTVSVSWEKDKQPDEPMTAEDDLIRTEEISNEEEVEMTSADVQEEAEESLMEEIKAEGEAEEEQSTEIVLVVESEEESTEEKVDDTEVIKDKETEDKDDVEMESSAGEDKDCEKTKQDAQSDGEEEDEKDKKTKVRRKRKAKSSIDVSPSKKVKIVNDGYCLYVGNLDNSKYYEEIKNALANYFMTQSLLVQDIRLDKAKKYAFVDLASQMDLTKALTLDGQKLLDKPLKIAKAKVKEVDLEKKKKDPQEVQKNRNERCVHVENIPSSATKEDVLKVFPKAIAVRFLGGADSPSKGVAFVEFQNKNQADLARSQSGTATIQKSTLVVNVVREDSGVRRTKSDSKKKKSGEAAPSNTLFVGNLPAQVQTKQLKKIFKNAVHINIPQSDGKSKGYAFVEFASVAHAEKALKASKNAAIQKRPLKIQFGLKSKTPQAQVPSKTLIVLGLHQKTTADTLTDAFEGALSSRIFVDKDTGLSRKFGFVDFESADSCVRAKEAAEDVEIDGSKVTVAFARPKSTQAPDTGESGPHRGAKKGQTPGKGRGAGRPLLKKTKVSSKN